MLLIQLGWRRGASEHAVGSDATQLTFINR